MLGLEERFSLVFSSLSFHSLVMEREVTISQLGSLFAREEKRPQRPSEAKPLEHRRLLGLSFFLKKCALTLNEVGAGQGWRIGNIMGGWASDHVSIE
jgi:hypothetical protein